MTTCEQIENARDPIDQRNIPRWLEKGEVVRVERMRPGERLVCRQGRLWITLSGVDRDIVLQAGQSFEIDRAAAVVIEALEAACFSRPATCPVQSV